MQNGTVTRVVSTVFFRRYIRSVADAHAATKWNDARKKLLAEMELVKDLQREVATISTAGPGPGSLSQGMQAMQVWHACRPVWDRVRMQILVT